MRSIRLSLLVYFLGLVATALGVASLLIYGVAQRTLARLDARGDQPAGEGTAGDLRVHGDEGGCAGLGVDGQEPRGDDAARIDGGPPVLHIADSNFGMYTHDLEICDVITEIRDRYGRGLCSASTTFHVQRPTLNSPARVPPRPPPRPPRPTPH